MLPALTPAYASVSTRLSAAKRHADATPLAHAASSRSPKSPRLSLASIPTYTQALWNATSPVSPGKASLPKSSPRAVSPLTVISGLSRARPRPFGEFHACRPTCAHHGGPVSAPRAHVAVAACRVPTRSSDVLQGIIPESTRVRQMLLPTDGINARDARATNERVDRGVDCASIAAPADVPMCQRPPCAGGQTGALSACRLCGLSLKQHAVFTNGRLTCECGVVADEQHMIAEPGQHVARAGTTDSTVCAEVRPESVGLCTVRDVYDRQHAPKGLLSATRLCDQLAVQEAQAAVGGAYGESARRREQLLCQAVTTAANTLGAGVLRASLADATQLTRQVCLSVTRHRNTCGEHCQLYPLWMTSPASTVALTIIQFVGSGSGGAGWLRKQVDALLRPKQMKAVSAQTRMLEQRLTHVLKTHAILPAACAAADAQQDSSCIEQLKELLSSARYAARNVQVRASAMAVLNGPHLTQLLAEDTAACELLMKHDTLVLSALLMHYVEQEELPEPACAPSELDTVAEALHAAFKKLVQQSLSSRDARMLA